MAGRPRTRAKAAEGETTPVRAPVKRPPRKPRKEAETRTPAVIGEILGRLSKGEPLQQILRDNSDSKPKPSSAEWYQWLASDEDLRRKFARARAEGFDAIAAECLQIADEQNAEDTQRAKLRVETRLKLLAKWDPKRYGERLALAGDKETPLEHKHTLDLSVLDTPSLVQLRTITQALAKAKRPKV